MTNHRVLLSGCTFCRKQQGGVELAGVHRDDVADDDDDNDDVADADDDDNDDDDI